MGIAPRSIVPLLHVADVRRSIGFYEKLGFVPRNTFAPDGEKVPTWAWLESGGASLMVARAGEPVVARQQAVIFYVYCDDVAAARAACLEAGIEAAPIAFPFYAPRGEFRIKDPDGYALNGHAHVAAKEKSARRRSDGRASILFETTSSATCGSP